MIYSCLRPLIFHLDPETAHGLALKSLRYGLVPTQKPKAQQEAKGRHENLRVSVGQLDYPNPVGLAAGFDKNAEAMSGAFGLGFGFLEVGTVTPKPQTGNPKPRIFRLPEDTALINRLGFNNEGHSRVLARLKHEKPSHRIVGVNIGANKESADRIHDYVEGVRAFGGIASYLTLNISSPNTPGLRDLQEVSQLENLLSKVNNERKRAEDNHARHVPIYLKLAPDMDDDTLKSLLDVILQQGIDALIISNTTIERPSTLKEKDQKQEAGGLSGRPLFQKATQKLATAYLHAGQNLPLIGVGGITSPQDAIQKLEAGATLLQLYTGLVFKGPGLVMEIVKGLEDHLKTNKTTLDAMRGREAEKWASHQHTEA